MARFNNMTAAQFCLGETTRTDKYFKEKRREDKDFFKKVVNTYFTKSSGSYQTTAFMDVLDIVKNDKNEWAYLVEYLKNLKNNDTFNPTLYEQRIRFLDSYSSRLSNNSLPEIDISILFGVIPPLTFDSDTYKKSSFWSRMIAQHVFTNTYILRDLFFKNGIDINSIIARNNFVITPDTLIRMRYDKILEDRNIESYSVLLRCIKDSIFDTSESRVLKMLMAAHPDFLVKCILEDFKKRFNDIIDVEYYGIFRSISKKGMLSADLLFKDDLDDAVNIIAAYMMLNN